MSNTVYVNGRLLSTDEPHVSALDRGFTLGDGAFETMRAVGGRIFRFQDHFARLGQSCNVLGFSIALEDSQIREAIGETLAANDLSEAVVRLAVSRGVPEMRGLLPPQAPSPTIVIQAMPFASFPEEKYASGFTAIISSIRRNESSPASRIKSSNYLDNIFARIEASARECDEAIMLNTAGHPACGSSSNFFLVTNGRIITPPPESGVLTGITRGVVREMLPQLGLVWDEREIGTEELFSAEEAFITNSVTGIGPLVKVDGKAIGTGKPGPDTYRIRKVYLGLIEEFRRESIIQ